MVGTHILPASKFRGPCNKNVRYAFFFNGWGLNYYHDESEFPVLFGFVVLFYLGSCVLIADFWRQDYECMSGITQPLWSLLGNIKTIDRAKLGHIPVVSLMRKCCQDSFTPHGGQRKP